MSRDWSLFSGGRASDTKRRATSWAFRNLTKASDWFYPKASREHGSVLVRYDGFLESSWAADYSPFGQFHLRTLELAFCADFMVFVQNGVVVQSQGTPKILHVSRRGKHWIANVVCYIGEAPEKVPVSSAVGIDLGLTTLATLSDGTEIPNPRWTKQEEDRLAEANQALSHKTRGSKNRAKAKERLRRVHQRIAGLRLAYVTQAAKRLIGKYDLIAHESLNIRGMAQSNLAKSITDAAWGKLIWRINIEAENAGRWVIPVNPRNTTKMCSGCGEIVPKTLSQRTHSCPACGLSLGRDHNAALNILRLGESLVSKQNCSMIALRQSYI